MLQNSEPPFLHQSLCGQAISLPGPSTFLLSCHQRLIHLIGKGTRGGMFTYNKGRAVITGPWMPCPCCACGQGVRFPCYQAGFAILTEASWLNMFKASLFQAPSFQEERLGEHKGVWLGPGEPGFSFRGLWSPFPHLVLSLLWNFVHAVLSAWNALSFICHLSHFYQSFQTWLRSRFFQEVTLDRLIGRAPYRPGLH